MADSTGVNAMQIPGGIANSYSPYPQQAPVDSYQAYQAYQAAGYGYPQQMPAPVPTVARPSWLPATAQAVTLHGTLGWFVPDPSAEEMNMQEQSRKRVEGTAINGMKRLRITGDTMPPRNPVANPGLDGSEVAYSGKVKYAVNPNTGYGFIASEAVQVLNPGKDVFLHQKLCPWVTDMNLSQGESVQFNFIVNAKGSPQVNRIVRASN